MHRNERSHSVVGLMIRSARKRQVAVQKRNDASLIRHAVHKRADEGSSVNSGSWGVCLSREDSIPLAISKTPTILHIDPDASDPSGSLIHRNQRSPTAASTPRHRIPVSHFPRSLSEMPSSRPVPLDRDYGSHRPWTSVDFDSTILESHTAFLPLIPKMRLCAKKRMGAAAGVYLSCVVGGVVGCWVDGWNGLGEVDGLLVLVLGMRAWRLWQEARGMESRR
jgi:hypothetical protein